MPKLQNKEQNFELLLENMIRIQGKLIEKVDILSDQMSQVENTLQQTAQYEPLSMPFLGKNTLQSENHEPRKL